MKQASAKYYDVSFYGDYEAKLIYYLLSNTRELLKGETEGLLKLPTDTALLDDPHFRPYVELYAKVMWAFFPNQMPLHDC